MAKQTTMTTTLIIQMIFLGLLLINNGLIETIFFGVFWISTISTLYLLVQKKQWKSTDWIIFSAFTTSTIMGVLISTHKLQDEIGLGVVIMGLLLVSAIINSIPNKKKRVTKNKEIKNQNNKRRRNKKSKKNHNKIYVTTKKGTKYHLPSCSLIKNKKNLKYYKEEKEAKKDNNKPCKRCIK